MEITIQTLLRGSPTTIKNKEFFATKVYVEKFLNFFKKYIDKFVVNVETPKQITNNDITYNKVWIQAIFPNKIKGYSETYGLVYSLNNSLIKFYKAYINDNGNLLVLDKNWITVKEINSKEFEDKKIIEKYVILGLLIEKALLFEYVDEFGVIKISPLDVIKAYNNVYHNKLSKNYVDKKTSLLNYYDALCTQITESKDIINRFEKTLLVSKIFNILQNEINNKT